MKRFLISAVAACLILGCSSSDRPIVMPEGAKEIMFLANSPHRVYADFYPSKTSNGKKVVLMFHQAGSNAGEYETIAPQITDLGFDCIAIDQRSGGDMWGRYNRTVKRSGSGNYEEAFNDLRFAVKYAVAANYTSIIVWGSSYSASLVFELAPMDPHIKAVIAFSPGEYMDDKSAVKTWASKVKLPVFVGCTPEEQQDGRQLLFDVIPGRPKVLAAIPGGIHGSSTLIPDECKVAAQYMARVKHFLAKF